MADDVDYSKAGERIQLAVSSREQLGLELAPTIERLLKIAIELMDLRRSAPPTAAEYLETAIARQFHSINELRHLAGLPRILAVGEFRRAPAPKVESGVRVGNA